MYSTSTSAYSLTNEEFSACNGAGSKQRATSARAPRSDAIRRCDRRKILEAMKRAAITRSPFFSDEETKHYGNCKGPATQRRLFDVPPFNSDVQVFDSDQPSVAAASNVLSGHPPNPFAP